MSKFAETVAFSSKTRYILMSRKGFRDMFKAWGAPSGDQAQWVLWLNLCSSGVSRTVGADEVGRHRQRPMLICVTDTGASQLRTNSVHHTILYRNESSLSTTL